MSSSNDEETTRPGTNEVTEPTGMQSEVHSTRGTFVILLVYLVIIVGLWGTVYLTLLQRG